MDTSLFPFKAWRRIQRDLLTGEPSLLNHGHRQGDENLREAIAAHLREARGAKAGADAIVVGAGIEYPVSYTHLKDDSGCRTRRYFRNIVPLFRKNRCV